METQYTTYNRSLFRSCKANGIIVIDEFEKLNAVNRQRYVDKYFKENVYPVLTPMAVDASRPFPLIRNKTLNIVALLMQKENTDKRMAKHDAEFATVQVPSVLPRLVEIPSERRRRYDLYSVRADHRAEHRKTVFELQCDLCISVPYHAECGSEH